VFIIVGLDQQYLEKIRRLADQIANDNPDLEKQLPRLWTP
jgi:hypothetical protein